VRELLVQSDVELLFDTGPAQVHEMPMARVHEPELDALGLSALQIVVELLQDSHRAEAADVSLDFEMRVCALHYLLRFADRVALPIPDRAAAASTRLAGGADARDVDWVEQQRIWTDWVATAQARGAVQ
jgi:hypothetical protein